MVQEYFFSSSPEFEKALEDTFSTTANLAAGPYLISNTKRVSAEIYVPEINFYLKNSQDTFLEKLEGIKRLYDLRALEYDLAQDTEVPTIINCRILLISVDPQMEITKDLIRNGYSVIGLHPDEITRVTGSEGDFTVNVEGKHTPETMKADHILWFDAPEEFAEIQGFFDPQKHSLEEIIASFVSNPQTILCKKYIGYDPSLCISHKKTGNICKKCSTACSVGALKKDSISDQPAFSHVLCNGCGACARVCPSGALEYLQIPGSSFERICSYYKDKIALIIPRRIDPDTLHFPLPQHVLPLTVENENFLDEYHLLSLFQTSGNPIVICTDTPSGLLQDIGAFLNEILRRKYGKKAIFICDNEQDLAKVLSCLPEFKDASFSIETGYLRKRPLFAGRLAHVVGFDDLGIVDVPTSLPYGNLTIAKDRCTLCLACVGACTLTALTAHPKDNTLRFTPALCAACGNCDTLCPESDCLEVVGGTLALRPESFRANIMASDELMECTECKKPFAPRKSIEKIAGLMRPIFAEDPVKLKTLYCCQDCKAKIMIESRIGGNFNPGARAWIERQ